MTLPNIKQEYEELKARARQRDQAVLDLWLGGMKQAEIGAKMNMSRQRVQYILKKLEYHLPEYQAQREQMRQAKTAAAPTGE